MSKPTIIAATDCGGSGCPTTYTIDGENVIVQGYLTEASGIDLPDGEGLVRIPRSLILETAARLHESGS